MSAKNFLQLAFLFLLNISFISAQTTGNKLSFSHTHGFYTAPFELQISSSIPGAKIRYTLNGKDPYKSEYAQEAVSPVTIKVDPSVIGIRDKAPGFIVTACAVLNDTLASKVITQTYLFPNKIIELSPHNQVPGEGWLVPGSSDQEINYGLDPRIYNDPTYGPQMAKAFSSISTVSIVTDLEHLFDPDSGIYVNAKMHSEEWERSASIELLNPDSSEGFQINCGLRIRGAYSRGDFNPKHAFRVFFKSEYGKSKLNYPVFGNEGATEFDKFDVQTAQNYSWSMDGNPNNTFIREIFSRDTQRDMGQPYTRGRFCHLFINGTYFGLYQIQERAEAAFGATYFGGNKEDYDVIKVNCGVNRELFDIEAADGTMDKWKELWEAGEKDGGMGFASDSVYFRVQGLNIDGTVNPAYSKLLDIDNLIDYMLVVFYTGNADAPITGPMNGQYLPNNFFAIYNRVKPDGFKFFQHDAEHSLFWNNDRTVTLDCGSILLKSNPQWIHQRLCNNPHYKLRFADRVFKHFYNGGALTLQKNIDRINERRKQIEYAIVAESARWGDSKTTTPMTKANWTNAVNWITNTFLPTTDGAQSRNDVVLNQLKNRGLYVSGLVPPTFNKTGGIVQKGFNLSFTAGSGTVYYTTDGTDPCSPFTDTGDLFTKTVIEPSSAKKVLVPKSAVDVSWRQDPSFDDSSWLICTGLPGGIGYETGSGYENLISLNLKNYMYQTASNANTTCYIRIPFELTQEETGKINTMQLQIMYDDGFVAYINGEEVAQANVPSVLSYNSAATTDAAQEGIYNTFDLSQYTGLLKAGKNILAIHGMNKNTSSSDLLFLPKLIIGKSLTGQTGTVSKTSMEYKDPIVINKTTTIKARKFTGSKWSPMNEATFIVEEDLSKLRITELHYHPLDQDTVSDKAFEFIELKNCGGNDIQLQGATFTTGIDYKFGDKTLAPGQYIVLASDKVHFNERYGFMPYDSYTGQLDNGGERITLLNATGDTVFSFSYKDKLPWPEEADGKGYSLVSANYNGTGNPSDATYWVKSSSIHGSPGKQDGATDVKDEDQMQVIKEFRISQNYPNPFNPTTIINYDIPRNSRVELKVYDILGQLVKELVNTEQPKGSYKIIFNADGLSSGIYFYTIKAGDFTKTQKMILLR